VDPERKDCVTIFFSDIVGFTDISSTLDPEKISIMLHRYAVFVLVLVLLLMLVLELVLVLVLLCCVV